jgi:hypothetical protein
MNNFMPFLTRFLKLKSISKAKIIAVKLFYLYLGNFQKLAELNIFDFL